MKAKTYNFEARLNSFVRSKQGVFLKLELTPNDIPDELSTAAVGQRFMVAVSEIGDMDEDLGAGERTVQLAGILCRTPDFQDYIIEYVRSRASSPIHHEPSELTAAKLMKRVLGIESRAELKDDKSAQNKFDQLKEDYDRWLIKTKRAL